MLLDGQGNRLALSDRPAPSGVRVLGGAPSRDMRREHGPRERQAAEADPGSDRLFVTKVPQNATREDLADHFARFGQTTDVYVPAVPGMPGHKGIAFVSFAEPGALVAALNHPRAHEIKGQEVVLDVAAPRGQPAGRGAVPGGRRVLMAPKQELAAVEHRGDRIFVTKIPPAVQKDHLVDHFSQFGDLTDVYLPAIPGAALHKGIAFVSFAEASSMQAALAHTGHEVNGHPVVVDEAAPRGSAPSQRAPPGAARPQRAPAPGHARGPNTGVPVPGRLFVTRVMPDITKEDLQSYFGRYGTIDDVYIPGGGNGKGIAFVSFRDAASARRAFAESQHVVKPGRAVLVDQALDRPPLGGRAPPVVCQPPPHPYGAYVNPYAAPPVPYGYVPYAGYYAAVPGAMPRGQPVRYMPY